MSLKDWTEIAHEQRVATLEAPRDAPTEETLPVRARSAARRLWLLAARVPHPGLWAALAIGLYVRFWLILRDNFPLNDGGLFYTMARDIQQNGFVLPATTSYNGGLPFAYPPLGIYIAAFVELVTPLDMAQVFRFLPLAFNALAIVAAYFLFRAMLGRGTAAAFAVLAFVLLPRSYTWMIVGGGMTRSPAFLFAVLGLLSVYLLYTRRDWRYVWPAAGFSGLTVLTHPEVGWFLAFSCGLFYFRYGLHRRGTLGSAAIVAATFVLSMPWWATVMARHGLDPFTSAASTGDHSLWWQAVRNLHYLYFTEEPYMKVLGALGLLGGFVAIARGHVILAVWFLVMFVAEPRSAATYATLPFAMFIGLVVTEVLIPGLRSRSRPEPLSTNGNGLRHRPSNQLLPSMVAVLLLVFVGGYAIVNARAANGQILETVSEGDRLAMDWVVHNTPPDSEFLVMEPDGWADAQTSEWFPALTGRRSVATVQGMEWVGSESFVSNKAGYGQIAGCAFNNIECVRLWTRLRGESYDYIYLSKRCCGGELIGGLNGAPEFELVYVTSDVGIWRVREAPTPLSVSTNTGFAVQEDG